MLCLFPQRPLRLRRPFRRLQRRLGHPLLRCPPRRGDALRGVPDRLGKGLPERVPLLFRLVERPLHAARSLLLRGEGRLTLLQPCRERLCVHHAPPRLLPCFLQRGRNLLLPRVEAHPRRNLLRP